MNLIKLIILEMRPKQWTKNLLLFAGLVFAHKLVDVPRALSAVAGFFIYCGLSGVVYIYNDIKDADSDRQHPLKCKRPIASGELPQPVALAVGFTLAAVCIASGFLLNWPFGALALAYFLVMLLYSSVLKHVVILDLMIVAMGFVIRGVAGVLAISGPRPEDRIPITPWFIMCILFLALFIVICKRRHEIVLLSASARHHRPVLEHYSKDFLDQMVSVATAATVLSYALYVTLGVRPDGGSPDKTGIHHPELMIWTLPFVLYGIFRYLYLVYKRDEGGAPEVLLLQDPSLLVNVLLWFAAVVAIFYI
ncbi:MAG: decaprenyl-phosphate phosphoribosyltransferase [Candidatus Sumerlaeaceae bacterium]|nr:decaprenyl-phosphate phosphoribosyltransferase [Candidatus Sumerlaeaceae bacterium]